ncbi:MAG: Na+/H+ antiporter NhaA [Bacteroidales bacterium]|nr:Na+/H+ antiporter NhaA [Bacteroidales bacterium]
MKTVFSPFHRFARVEFMGGIVLVFSALIAMVIANTALSSTFTKLFNTNVSLKINGFQLSDTLANWINQGLMAIFFFVAGLEIKREVMLGELSSVKKASLPVFAALGGVIIPVLLFTVINNNEVSHPALLVTAMTDIAFCFLVLGLIGKRVPENLKIFVFAYAIAGNLLTTSVSIILNHSEINLKFLLIGLGLYLYLVIFNILKLRIIQIYMLIGWGIWYMFYRSGIHPALAGIFIAFTIPKERKIRTSLFRKRLEANLQEFASDERKSKVELTDKQLIAIDNIVAETGKVKSPLQSLEHRLHGFVSYFVLPLFIMVNGGIWLFNPELSFRSFSALHIVAISMVLGKTAGIFLFSWGAVKLRLAFLPAGVNWVHLLGAALVGGIGFSMSLFINGLLNIPQGLSNQIIAGIYTGSFVAALSGFMVLRLVPGNKIKS